MIVRSALKADIPALAALERKDGATAWSAATLLELFLQETVEVLVMEDHEPIGFAIVRRILDEAEVFTLVIATEHRTNGLGRRLLEACHHQWQTAGVRHGHLEVRASNTAAIALYRSCGWQQTGRRSAYYRDGEDALTLTWSAP